MKVPCFHAFSKVVAILLKYFHPLFNLYIKNYRLRMSKLNARGGVSSSPMGAVLNSTRRALVQVCQSLQLN